MINDVPSEVIEKLFNNGFEEQLVDIMIECEGTDYSMSDAPLSPTAMKGNKTRIIYSEEVFKKYKELVERANEQPPIEIPYILTGKKKEIDGQETLLFKSLLWGYKDEKELKDITVSIDENIFDSTLTGDNDVISIGHTHPKVPDELKEKMLTTKLPQEIKTKYQIRDVGLNLSVADIWQHEAWKQQASAKGFKGKVLQTIIAYNGDVIALDDESISTYENISATNEYGLPERIPTPTDKVKEL